MWPQILKLFNVLFYWHAPETGLACSTWSFPISRSGFCVGRVGLCVSTAGQEGPLSPSSSNGTAGLTTTPVLGGLTYCVQEAAREAERLRAEQDAKRQQYEAEQVRRHCGKALPLDVLL
jgi:hypothetical protein